MNDLIKRIQETKTFYLENPTINKMVEIEINESIYLLLKTELLDTMMFVIEKEDYKETKRLCTFVRTGLRSPTEHAILDALKDEIDKFFLNKLYNINQIKTNSLYNEICRKHKIIKGQYNNFNSFKNNQNKFDNMISIIKIVNRLKAQNIEVNTENLIFDSTEDLTDSYNKEFVEQNLKTFRNVIFSI